MPGAAVQRERNALRRAAGRGGVGDKAKGAQKVSSRSDGGRMAGAPERGEKGDEGPEGASGEGGMAGSGRALAPRQ